MAGDKLKLDDDGFAILGNALLLGYMANRAKFHFMPKALKTPELYQNDRVEAGERKELYEVLDRAGALGNWYCGGFDPLLEAAVQPIGMVYQRSLDVAAADSPLAKLRLMDIDFGSLAMRGVLADALKTAVSYELRMPLARLGPTDLTRAVLKLVLEYFMQDMALVSGISPGEAAFIGPDSLKCAAKLLTQDKPMDRLVRDFVEEPEREAEAIKREAELQAMVLLPAKAALNIPGTADSAAVSQLLINYERFMAGQSAAQNWHMGRREGLIDLVIAAAGQGAISAMVAVGAGQNYHHVRAKVWGLGLRLVVGGKILAVGRIAGRTMQVPAEWFKAAQFLSVKETDLVSAVEDIAYIALVNLVDTYAPNEPGPKPTAKNHLRNRGLSCWDEPYIIEGLKMVAEGDAKSANHAATMLVDRYGEVSLAQKVPGCRKILSQGKGTAIGRLGKKIAARIRSQGDNVFQSRSAT